MKKITGFLLLALCLAVVASAQKKTIEPSGNIVTKEISVQSFNAIKAEGIYELIISQGNAESVKIEADDNVQELFTVTNSGNTLVIDMPKLDDKNLDISDDKKKNKSLRWKVYVSCKNLKSIDVAVIGNVRSDASLKSDAFEIKNRVVGNMDIKLATEKLTMRNEGVGKVRLEGTATNATIKNAGVGELEGSELLVQTMNIDNSGVGHANVNVQKDLTVQQSFLGKVSNKGQAKKHEMDGVEM